MTILNFLRAIVQTPSLSGDEGAVAGLVKDEMKELGLQDISNDEYGNIFGFVSGEGDKTLLFDAHMDTVAAAAKTEWKHDPFGAELNDGKLYGRGSTDMKGPLASMLYGVADLLSEQRSLEGNICVSSSVCEEVIEGMALARVMEEVKPDYVVIAEPSGLSLVKGQRGRAEIRLTVKGTPAHSASPWQGRNAVKKTIPLLLEIEKMHMPSQETLGKGLMEITDIMSKPYPAYSVIPELCEITYDRRLLVGETEESVLSEVEAAIQRVRATDPDIEASTQIAQADIKAYTGVRMTEKKFLPAWETPIDHHLISSAMKALAAEGLGSRLSTYQFCTNGSYSAGKAGVPTIGFGPSNPELAHKVDEYINLSEVHAARRGYAAIAKGVLAAES